MPLGKLGLVANKGALAIELKLRHEDGLTSSVLFVASHLAAHDQGVHKRNLQSRTILEHLYKRGKLGYARDQLSGFHSKMPLSCQVS